MSNTPEQGATPHTVQHADWIALTTALSASPDVAAADLALKAVRLAASRAAALKQRDGDRAVIQFLMTQVKHLAETFWSPDDAAEWLNKCDAYNAGQRAIAAEETH